MRHILRPQLKIRAYLLRSLHKQLDRAVATQGPPVVRRGRKRRFGNVQAGQRIEIFPLDLEAGPRGDQDLHPRSRGEQVGHKPYAIASLPAVSPCPLYQEMFIVVHHQQNVLAPQIVKQLLSRRGAGAAFDVDVEGIAQGIGHSGHHPLGRLNWRQRDKKDAVLETVCLDQILGQPQGQPRLANPPGTEQRKQAACWILEAGADLSELYFAADKGPGLSRQVVADGCCAARQQRVLGRTWRHRHVPRRAAADLLIEGRGLLGGCQVQFLAQDANALLVLAQGGGPLAGLCVQLHELPVSRLVQGVQGQPTPGIG